MVTKAFDAMTAKEKDELVGTILDAADRNDADTVIDMIDKHNRHPDLFTAGATQRLPPALSFMLHNNTDAIDRLRNLDATAFVNSWKQPISQKNQAQAILDDRMSQSYKPILWKDVNAKNTIAMHPVTVIDVAQNRRVTKKTLAHFAFGPMKQQSKVQKGLNEKPTCCKYCHVDLNLTVCEVDWQQVWKDRRDATRCQDCGEENEGYCWCIANMVPNEADEEFEHRCAEHKRTRPDSPQPSDPCDDCCCGSCGQRKHWVARSGRLECC